MDRRDFFNSMAATWDARCQYDHGRINEILDLLPIRFGDSILDVGAGTGILIPFLLERVGDRGTITAIDMAENMIRIARKKFPRDNVCFEEENIFAADLPTCAFDVIMCYSVFPHLDDKSNVVKLLVQYLNWGGIIAICHSQSREAVNHKHKTVHPAVANDHLPTAQVLAEYLIDAGCEIIRRVDTSRLFVVAGQKKANQKQYDSR